MVKVNENTFGALANANLYLVKTESKFQEGMVFSVLVCCVPQNE